MKLIIQIPCLNEETTLPDTIRDLPTKIEGMTEIEYLVIDDGSTDQTAEVARSLGVHHVLQLGSNRGLARAFSRGIEYALAQGADIVVNTDADNQYRGEDIARLVQPILANQADLVVGCRPIIEHPEFTPAKKLLQRLGSWTLRQVSQTTVRDAASGFRAFSREACQRLFVYSSFSYCMETLIQAGTTGLRVASVDIRVNASTRPSRLFKSVPQYLAKSGMTIFTMFMLYRPGRFFAAIGGFLLAIAFALGFRFIWLVYLSPTPDPGRTYLPSLILTAICGVMGLLVCVLGVLGELVKFQRRLQEESLYQLRRSRGNRDQEKHT
ncbi:MAG: glycosyltransferase family 2 protein [Verrucomicrobia bacterium]|nr:glycosyltransferase family 2 protein [Verrucomicrobiota bacterium]